MNIEIAFTYPNRDNKPSRRHGEIVEGYKEYCVVKTNTGHYKSFRYDKMKDVLQIKNERKQCV